MNNISVSFDGTDITSDIMPYVKSLTYTDNEEEKTDDLQIVLQDRDGTWLYSWASEIILAASSQNKISAVIVSNGYGLACGVFELDSVNFSEPPLTCTLKATSLPFNEPVRQTLKSRAWENINLSQIAAQIASEANMQLALSIDHDTTYEYIDQTNESDISFLLRLCRDNGISLKCSNGNIILFQTKAYNDMAPVTHITRGSGYISCKLSTGEASRSYSKCVVSYTNPETGEAITGTANADKKTDKNKQVLTFNTVGVRTQEQAERVARAQLNLANKFEMKLDFTMVGNPALMAGASISVGGFGAFDGTYVISKAVHTVSESAGYTTSITLRV